MLPLRSSVLFPGVSMPVDLGRPASVEAVRRATSHGRRIGPHSLVITAVQRDPNNLQLRNDLAQAYIERENLMAVFEQTKFVLEKSPTDSRALTFQALVRMAMGEADELEEAIYCSVHGATPEEQEESGRCLVD